MSEGNIKPYARLDGPRFRVVCNPECPQFGSMAGGDHWYRVCNANSGFLQPVLPLKTSCAPWYERNATGFNVPETLVVAPGEEPFEARNAMAEKLFTIAPGQTLTLRITYAADGSGVPLKPSKDYIRLSLARDTAGEGQHVSGREQVSGDDEEGDHADSTADQ